MMGIISDIKNLISKKDIPSGKAIASHQNDIYKNFMSGMNKILEHRDSVLIDQRLTLDAYRELLRDDQVHATFQQRRLAVTSMDWTVQPGAEDDQSKAAADFLTLQLHRIGWDSVVDKMLFALLYGYSVAECIWTRDGAQVVLDSINVLNPRRFVFDVDNKLRLLTRENQQEGILLPEKKFWTFCAGAETSDDPYGKGLGHFLYWPVFFKRNSLKLWLVYLDKFGMPTAMGKFPNGTTLQDQRLLLDSIDAIHSESALVIPEGQEVTLLEGTRAGSPSYDLIVGMMNDAISKVVLSQTMTTDALGGQVKGEVQQKVAQSIAEADSDLVNLSFDRSIGKWLTEWNFPGAKQPKVTRVTDAPDDLNLRAERDTKLFAIGFEPSEEYVGEHYGEGWTKKAVVDVSVTGGMPGGGLPPDKKPVPGQPAQPQQPPKKKTVNFAERDPAYSPDSYTDDALAHAGDAMREMIDPVRNAVNKVDSLGGLADGFFNLFKKMKADKFIRLLEKSLVLAHVTGIASVQQEISDSADFADTSAWQDVPFEEAIGFFRNKINMPTKKWNDLVGNAHDTAFVSAGAMKADLLADLRRAVDKAIAEGGTIEEFRAAFDDTVAANGWDYVGTRDWRTRLIFQQNIFTSYAAGRYEQMTDPDVLRSRPYWQYKHSGKLHPRKQHLAWSGMILRADDPWWGAHYPPKGFGCGCTAFSVSNMDLDREGLRVDRAPTGDDVGVDSGFHGGPVGESRADRRNFLKNKFEGWGQELTAFVMDELE